jgi:hypothetical protein
VVLLDVEELALGEAPRLRYTAAGNESEEELAFAMPLRKVSPRTTLSVASLATGYLHLVVLLTPTAARRARDPRQRLVSTSPQAPL